MQAFVDVVGAFGGKWGFEKLSEYGKVVGSRAMAVTAELVRCS